MNDEEKKEFLMKCYNETTGKWDIPCKCGFIRNLNHKQIWVINMHSLKCGTCGSEIIGDYYK